MTKADIAERIQDGTGLTRKESAEMMEEVFSIMKSTLEQGENLKISGFGSFVVKRQAPITKAFLKLNQWLRSD